MFVGHIVLVQTFLELFQTKAWVRRHRVSLKTSDHFARNPESIRAATGVGAAQGRLPCSDGPSTAARASTSNRTRAHVRADTNVEIRITVANRLKRPGNLQGGQGIRTGVRGSGTPGRSGSRFNGGAVRARSQTSALRAAFD
jgi:hypothetical protein